LQRAHAGRVALGVLLGGIVVDRTAHHHRVAAVGFAASALVILTIGTVDLGTKEGR
jgi:hypothetical protein